MSVLSKLHFQEKSTFDDALLANDVGGLWWQHHFPLTHSLKDHYYSQTAYDRKNRKERLGKCQKISSNLNTSPLCAVRKVTRFNFYCGVRCLGSTQCCSSKRWEFSAVQVPLDTDRWLLPQWQQEICFLVDISRQTRSRLQNTLLHRQGWS